MKSSNALRGVEYAVYTITDVGLTELQNVVSDGDKHTSSCMGSKEVQEIVNSFPPSRFEEQLHKDSASSIPVVESKSLQSLVSRRFEKNIELIKRNNVPSTGTAMNVSKQIVNDGICFIVKEYYRLYEGKV